MRKKDLRAIQSALTIVVLTLACLFLLMPSLVLAQKEKVTQVEVPADQASDHSSPTAASETPEAGGPVAMTGDFKSAIVIDADTGLTLVATNPDDRRQPASMLKMMTELIVLERVAEGDVKLDEMVEVSAKASKMGGSQVYLKHGTRFSVEDLLRALAIHSANDAAVALAEHVAGSTEAFVDLMNMRAQDLGMHNSEFHSVHGLPPGWKQSPDMTTARDMAILGRELIKHPSALEWASTATAPFENGTFKKLYNPNKLIGKFRGLDGIKTGYTGPAGFCVTASAVQKGKRLISVVMGCSTDKARATETTRLLSYGFNAYRQVAVVPAAGALLPDPIKLGGAKKKTAPLAYGAGLTLSVPRGREDDIEEQHLLPEKVEAPQPKDTRVGAAVFLLDGQELGRVPLVLAEEVEKGNWWNRLLN
jgi:D-alanyl-D-alanine carboxypeptidase (penicillin-binding protein 5/6)